MNKYVITIATRNAEKYIQRAIISAIQDHPNYRVIISDDASTDNTWNLIMDQTCLIPNFQYDIMRNKERLGVVGNHYQMAQGIDDDEIIVVLDGDDQLAHVNVLNELDFFYNNPEVWMTYGSFEYDHESRNPDPNASPRGFARPMSGYDRRWPFTCSHLRTYRAWLFKAIKKEDLMFNGNFYQLIADHVTMYPMLEMAGPKHSAYIDDILYLYNAANPYNEHKINIGNKPIQEEIEEMVKHFKSLPRYERLENALVVS